MQKNITIPLRSVIILYVFLSVNMVLKIIYVQTTKSLEYFDCQIYFRMPIVQSRVHAPMLNKYAILWLLVLIIPVVPKKVYYITHLEWHCSVFDIFFTGINENFSSSYINRYSMLKCE